MTDQKYPRNSKVEANLLKDGSLISAMSTSVEGVTTVETDAGQTSRNSADTESSTITQSESYASETQHSTSPESAPPGGFAMTYQGTDHIGNPETVQFVPSNQSTERAREVASGDGSLLQQGVERGSGSEVFGDASNHATVLEYVGYHPNRLFTPGEGEAAYRTIEGQTRRIYPGKQERLEKRQTQSMTSTPDAFDSGLTRMRETSCRTW